MKKVTIIMPTYNAERTIEKSLVSIREQAYEQDKIEILVVDGGSSDQTVDIAKKYGAVILKNPYKLPESAKEIGFLAATGEYAMYMDSDEIFQNVESIKKRIRIFDEEPNLKNIVATGKISESQANPTVVYSNYVSDPFSFFVYRLNGNNRFKELRKQYNCELKKEHVLFRFCKNDSLPLFDAATNMFEMECARRMYNEADNKKYFIANIFEFMVRDNLMMAMLYDDFIYHIPEDTYKIFLRKMKWRVINNVYKPEDEGIGFAARSQGNVTLNVRKYLYILYSASIILPVYDAVRLSVICKDKAFLLHFPINEYIFFQIAKYTLLKALGKKKPNVKTYGKK